MSDRQKLEHGASAFRAGTCACDVCRRAFYDGDRERRHRRGQRLREDPTLAPHGEINTYKNWGCRCHQCKRAYRIGWARRTGPAGRWVREYRRGASYRQLAEEAGLDEKTIRRAIGDEVKGLRRGGPRARNQPTEERVLSVWKRYGSIYTTATILNVSASFVQARLAAAGLMEHPDKRPRKS